MDNDDYQNKMDNDNHQLSQQQLSSDEDDNDYYNDEQEELLEFNNLKCLFCNTFTMTYQEMFTEHLLNEHNLDFIQLCRKNHFECYDYIKFINYIRKHQIYENDLQSVIDKRLFDNDEYLRPTMDDDHLLMFDYEGEIQSNDQDDENNKILTNEQLKERGKNLSKNELLKMILKMNNQLMKMDQKMNKMKNLLLKQNNDNDGDKINNIVDLDEQSDSYYIESYSHYYIHQQMLSDKPRTLAYQDAILENREFFHNKTVLDIGCGTGILSLFAAKSGAKLIVAVDHSPAIVEKCKKIIKDNNYDDRIKVINGKLERIDFDRLNLPNKYDIIISEWMGYFLLFEGMLDTVLYARDNLLNIDGALLPSRCKIFLSTFSDCKFFESNIDFWNDVYGFNMSSMIDDVITEVIVDVISSENICTIGEKIFDFDLMTMERSMNRWSSKFEFHFKNDQTIHGFVGWFDCYFELMTKLIILSTSPFSEQTHWKQTVFPLKEPLLIQAGQIVKGEISIIKNVKNLNPRSLQICLLIQNHQPLIYNII